MLFNQDSIFDKLQESCEVDIATGNINPIKRNKKGVDVMKIKMLKTVPGSKDGINIETFEKGEVYDLPLFLAESFTTKKYAEKFKVKPQETKVVEPEEIKVTQTEETKDDLSAKTITELKKIAKELKIKGYYKMQENELIKAIEETRK